MDLNQVLDVMHRVYRNDEFLELTHVTEIGTPQELDQTPYRYPRKGKDRMAWIKEHANVCIGQFLTRKHGALHTLYTAKPNRVQLKREGSDIPQLFRHLCVPRTPFFKIYNAPHKGPHVHKRHLTLLALQMVAGELPLPSAEEVIDAHMNTLSLFAQMRERAKAKEEAAAVTARPLGASTVQPISHIPPSSQPTPAYTPRPAALIIKREQTK